MRVNILSWDLMLVVVAVCHATVLTYTYDSRIKAVLIGLPTTFTVGVLAVGRSVDATNVLALLLLVVFTNAVRLFYEKLKLNIVASIVASALVYCVSGALLNRVVPNSSAAFWISVGLALVVALAIHVSMPPRDEPGHRTSMGIWAKLPLIILVVCALLAVKSQLQGFITLFPTVSILASYEARNSLYTMSRQMPVLIVTLTAMLVACRLSQGVIGIGPALVVGWLAFTLLFVPLTISTWCNTAREVRMRFVRSRNS